MTERDRFVLHTVADAFGLGTKELVDLGKQYYKQPARKAYAYMSQARGRTQKEIAKVMKRDRSTVGWLAQEGRRLAKEDQEFASKIAQIEKVMVESGFRLTKA